MERRFPGSSLDHQMLLGASCVFRSWEAPLFFFLFRHQPVLFLHLYLEHLVAVYNFYSLLFWLDATGLSVSRGAHVGGGLGPRRRWELGLRIRSSPSAHDFFAAWGSLCLVELGRRRGVTFTSFAASFFYDPSRRAVFLLEAAFVWLPYKFLIFMRNYVHQFALARYNTYVVGSVYWDKPLVRRALLYKARPDYCEKASRSFYLLDQFGVSLFFGRYVFYSLGGGLFSRRRFFIRGYFALSCAAFFGYRAWRLLLRFPGALMRSTHFVFGSSTSHALYAFRHVQRMPKKYFFAAWIQRWYMAFFQGSWWRRPRHRFWLRFLNYWIRRFCAWLFHGHGNGDLVFLESMVPSAFRSLRSFSTLWRRRLRHGSYVVFNYDAEAEVEEEADADADNTIVPVTDDYSYAFAQALSRYSYFHHRVSDILVWFTQGDAIGELLLDSFFLYAPLDDFFPYSYALHIGWKIHNPDIACNFFPWGYGLYSHFERLQLDSFFSSRLLTFLRFFEAYRGLLRHLAVRSQRRLQFHKRIFYLFHVRDYFHRLLMHSLPLSILAAFAAYSLPDAKVLRRCLLEGFVFRFYLRFRPFFSAVLGRFIVPPLREPWIYYDRQNFAALRFYYRQSLTRRWTTGLRALGRAHRVPLIKWRRVFPAYDGPSYFQRSAEMLRRGKLAVYYFMVSGQPPLRFQQKRSSS